MNKINQLINYKSRKYNKITSNNNKKMKNIINNNNLFQKIEISMINNKNMTN